MKANDADKLYIQNESVDYLYLGENLLWQNVISVTPAGPTFLDVPPWVVLPEQEGVIYSIVGTPGAGLPIEVHADPAEGYEIEGTEQWWWTFRDYDPVETYWSSSGTYTAPEWAGYLDIVCVGGGGGGAAGGSAVANAGEGGDAGQWGVARIDVDTLDDRQLGITVGSGGVGGSSTGAASGTRGGNSQAYRPGPGWLIGRLGLGGDPGSGTVGTNAAATGGSPGGMSYNGRRYQGGSGGANNNNSRGGGGSAPGGGGGGGAGGIFGTYWRGGGGGDGGVWVTAFPRSHIE